MVLFTSFGLGIEHHQAKNSGIKRQVEESTHKTS